MQTQRFLECLAADVARLRDVAAKDLDAPVPTCPGWVVRDLVRHVAQVYLHKAESIRRRELPHPWPPPLDREEPLALLDRAWGELTAEFARHDPADPAYTWHDADQTVGFWIRRMAQETVIHRLDAELALGTEVAPVPDDLAVDGIDEVLCLFLDYGSKRWPDEFGPVLPAVPTPQVYVVCARSAWSIAAGPRGVDVRRLAATPIDLATPPTVGAGDERPATVRSAPGGADRAVAGVRPGPQAVPAGAVALVSGGPVPLLRWLWSRGGDGVAVEGDVDAVARVRRLLAAATQ
jgi:uncharacterized protein (TIGR03083 family)